MDFSKLRQGAGNKSTRDSKMKKNICQLTLVLLMTMIAAHADATIIYLANLNGLAETPSNISSGTGLAMVEYDSVLHTLSIDVNFSGLAGLTTAAHIHCCIASPANVGVATTVPNFPGFPVGVTSGNFNNVFDLTLASSFNPSFITDNGGTVAGAESALAAGLATDQAYFDIHTQTFAGGEIRGFLIAQVPEPETYTMMLMGLGMMGFMVRRCKNEQV